METLRRRVHCGKFAPLPILSRGTGVAVLLALVQTGCVDAPEQPTSSLPSAASSPGREVTTPVVSCRLAERTASGSYRIKTVSVPISSDLLHPQGRTVTFAYRGWREGEADPARLAECDVPSTSGATELLRELFAGGAASPAASAASRARASERARQAGAIAPAAAVVFDAEVVDCANVSPRLDWGCSAESAAGWQDGGRETAGPPPPRGTSRRDLTPQRAGKTDPWWGTVSDQILASCYGQTDNPHASMHVRGTVNVVARTVCTMPMSVYVSTNLQKWNCFWIFCWWSSRGSNDNSDFDGTAQTNASALCETGWWRGRSFHSAVFPDGSYASTNTENESHVWC